MLLLKKTEDDGSSSIQEGTDECGRKRHLPATCQHAAVVQSLVTEGKTSKRNDRKEIDLLMQSSLKWSMLLDKMVKVQEDSDMQMKERLMEMVEIRQTESREFQLFWLALMSNQTGARAAHPSFLAILLARTSICKGGHKH